MATITIQSEEQTEKGWRFCVAVDGQGDAITYSVTLDKEYWEELTGSRSHVLTPEELVRRSFAFLLAKEPKESILKEFDLRIISRYFSDYEGTIKEHSEQ